MSHRSAAWITGVGTATPLGNSYTEFADNLMAGRSAVQRVTAFPVDDHPSQIAGRVAEVPLPPGQDAAEFAGRSHRLEQSRPLVLRRGGCRLPAGGSTPGAAKVPHRPRARLGCRVDGTVGDGRAGRRLEAVGGAPQLGTHAAAHLAHIGTIGTVFDDVGGVRQRQLRADAGAAVAGSLGWVDVCLAGACDMSVTPMSLACFGNLRAAVARASPSRQAASRPFDRGRDGFVMAEGRAIFVLERR